MGVLPDQQSEPQPGQVSKQPVMPLQPAFGAGWKITAATLSRVAEAHGYERHGSRVMQFSLTYTKPLTQALRACIVVPWNSGTVYPQPGRLTCNEDACL